MKQLLISSTIAMTIAAGAAAAAAADSGTRGCTFRVNVGNQSHTDSIRVTKISTNSLWTSPPIYKKQWDGSVTIAHDTQHRFSFTVDFACNGAHDVKIFYTKNGHDHERVCNMASGDYCGIT